MDADEAINSEFLELLDVIRGISDESLIETLSDQRERWKIHQLEKKKAVITKKVRPKSLSVAINELLKVRLVASGWKAESPIFRDPVYSSGSRWYLDFAKEEISVEVAFNHAEATAHNLIKPVLASELNHVDKAIQTRLGVIVTCMESLREAGNFDGAVGTFESFQTYLKPYQNILIAPLIIIGLEAPASFKIDKKSREIIQF
ncbi:hypothetical protein N8891_03710 [Flavobacteriales bacterium]|nr:hypothetical protein [Flavobacteriales bacterium]